MSNDRRTEELQREVATLKRDLAARDLTIEAQAAELDALRASRAAPAVAGEEAWVLKTRLLHNNVEYPPGAEMPFDPHNPPKGSEGLRQGVHYERLRVLRAPVAHA